MARSHTTVSRNERGDLRITHVAMDLPLSQVASALAHANRAFDHFEDFYVAKESVRQGIPVHIDVRGATDAIVRARHA